jgi:hypothetical protein
MARLRRGIREDSNRRKEVVIIDGRPREVVLISPEDTKPASRWSARWSPMEEAVPYWDYPVWVPVWRFSYRYGTWVSVWYME